MRVCPKCGYVDSYFWRPLPWDTDNSYTQLESFREICPELAARLEVGEREIRDQYYAYRLSGRGKQFVSRRAIRDLEEYGGWRSPHEKYKPSRNPPLGQKRLDGIGFIEGYIDKKNIKLRKL